MLWTLIFIAGILTGLRTFMPLAVLTVFVHHDSIRLQGSPMAFLRWTWVHVLIMLMALAELVGDKLPKTPARTSTVGLGGRIIVGGVTGATLALAKAAPWWMGALIGAIGAVSGTFGGWFARTRIVTALKCPDWLVAGTEDVITIAGSIAVMARIASL